MNPVPPSPVRSLQFALADSALPDGVEPWLRTQRCVEGLSYADMAFELRTRFGIRITAQAVRSWCLRLEIEA